MEGVCLCYNRVVGLRFDMRIDLAGNDYKWIRKASLASSIGFILVFSILIGWFIGSSLDKLLGTSPWLMLIFTLMGIAAGFIELIKIAIRLSKEE